MNKFRRSWFQSGLTNVIKFNGLLFLLVVLYAIISVYGCKGKNKKETAVLQLQVTSSEGHQPSSVITIDSWFIFSKQIEIKGLRDGEENIYISDMRMEQLVAGKKFSYNIPAGSYDYLNVYLMTPEENEVGDSTLPSIFVKGKINLGPSPSATKTFLVYIFLSRIIRFEEGDNVFKNLNPKQAYIALLDLNISEWLNSIPASVWLDAANNEPRDTLIINDGSHETLYNLIVSNIGKGATITIKEAP